MSQLEDGIPWWRVVYADGTPAICHHRTAAGLLADEQIPMARSKV
jgi:alkylated DNA nucleotide flippase Atl1